ncbi:MAG: hypothetical protein FJY85_16825, partial [Deltaproteobacteria bacterium]|nr:hypothetical protein [Deltaproteobacteria bacterium]
VGELQRPVSAVAEEECELVCFVGEAFTGLITEDLARKIVFNVIQKLRDSLELLEGSLWQDNLSRLIFGLMSLQRRSSAQNGREIDLRELRDFFRLEDDDQLKKYLGKLESLNVVQIAEQVVQVKNIDLLQTLLEVLCGQGKFVFKL